MPRSGGILIYCERTGAWAAALRREPGMASIPQRQTRSLVECQEALAEHPASLVLLEITPANLEKALEWLCWLSRDVPRARAIAVAQRGLECHEWVVREFGCLAFTTSPRELASVARLIECYFASLPVPQMTFEEQIWAQLPWQR